MREKYDDDIDWAIINSDARRKHNDHQIEFHPPQQLFDQPCNNLPNDHDHSDTDSDQVLQNSPTNKSSADHAATI